MALEVGLALPLFHREQERLVVQVLEQSRKSSTRMRNQRRGKIGPDSLDALRTAAGLTW